MTPAGRKYAQVNSSSRVHTNLTGPLRRPRQSRRFDRGFAGVLAAVTRARVRHQHADTFFWNAKSLGQFTPHAERPLRARPDRQVVARPLRQRSARFERRMGDVGDGVSLLQAMIGRSQRFLHRACLVAGRVPCRVLVLDHILLQIFEQLLVRRLRLGFPLRANGRDGTGGNFCARRRHSDKIAVADNGDAWNLFSFVRVEGDQSRSKRSRPQNLAVEHVRQFLVGRIAMLARDKVPAIDLRQ